MNFYIIASIAPVCISGHHTFVHMGSPICHVLKQHVQNAACAPSAALSLPAVISMIRASWLSSLSTRSTQRSSGRCWRARALLGGGEPIPSCNDYLSGRCMVSFQQLSTNRWGWRWYFSSPLIRALWEQRHKWRCFPSSLMRREVRQRNQFAFVSPGHSSCCDMHSPSHFYHSPFSCLFLLLFLLSLLPSGS